MTMGERICVLKEGRIQQVDAPTALYARPANAFVAGFIGSPEMNLMPARLGDGVVQVGEIALPLPQGSAAPGGARAVLFGLRPEHLGVLPRTDAMPVAATLRFVEHMGNEVFVHATLAGQAVTARIAAEQAGALQAAERGAAFTLHLQLGQAHFFDAGDGRTLRP
jgi:oligogalacturonide transport system ATP-binding protein